MKLQRNSRGRATIWVAVFPLLPVTSSSKAPCKVTVFPPGLCIPGEAAGDGQPDSLALREVNETPNTGWQNLEKPWEGKQRREAGFSQEAYFIVKC